MSEDRIERLLRDADEAAGPPGAPPADLAARVRRIYRRRRRSWACALAAVVVAAGVALYLAAPRPAAPPPGQTPSMAKSAGEGPAATADRLRAELAALHAEIRSRRDVIAEIERLRTIRQAAASAEAIEIPDPAADIRCQLEQAAYVSIQLACHLEHQAGKATEAAEAYRKVIACFPQTSWAAVARNRLSRLTGKTGEML